MGRLMVARKVGIVKYFVGISVSLIALLAGAWLMLAPFALGVQGDGEWIKATKIDIGTGSGVAVVALLGLVLFIVSLPAELAAAGIIGRKPVPATTEETEPAPVPQDPASPASNHGDEFDRAIAALAETLAADLAARRKLASEQPTMPFANGGEG
jgi:hypothetical protein